MTGSALNIVIKLIAVILAVFLWFNVVTKKNYEYEYTLQVTGVDLPPSLGAVTPLPDSLTVRVMAAGKKLLRDDWKTAGLRIKGSRLKRGYNTLELNSETVALVRPDEITLIDFPGATPIMIQLDRLDSMLVPVASRLAIVPREGYMVVADRGSISPLRTQLVGPEMTLKKIDSVYTEQKILDGIDASIQLTLALEKPAGLNISMAHDSALVEVVIDKINRRRFENIPVTIGAGRGGRVIVDPNRVSVEIEGPQSLLDSLIETQINVQITPPPGASGGYAKPTVTLPPNFTPAVVTPDSIRILVSP